jgi:phosphate transport system permease protein
MPRDRTQAAQRAEAWQRALFLAAGALLVCLMAAVLAWFVADTARLLGSTSLDAVLFGFRWAPEHGQYGLMPFIWGSVAVGVLALLGSVPTGIALGVVTARRIPPAAGRVVTGGLTGLVAVPSVIFGWWGLDVAVPAVRRIAGGPGFSLLAAGITVAVMVLPTLAVLAGEAIRGVPPALEDASRALGAGEDQTLWYVTLRAAGPGIVRAVILAAGRALAETMAVQMVVGGQPVARLPLTWPGSTLTTGILTHLALYPPDTPGAEAVTAMAFLLLIGTFLLQRELSHWERGG